MTHFDEMTCLLYLDGQLDGLKARELELHARSCSPCRTLLAVLQRESALLHQAMLEEEESVPAHLLAPPARESVPWGWIITLGFAALGAFTVWTEIIAPWQQSLSQAGFGGENLLVMLFFSGVFWKGWSQMTIVLQLLPAMTIAALLAYFLWRKRHRLSPVTMVLCGLALLLALPPSASAAEMVHKERYTLPAGESLNNDLVVYGRQIEIKGRVDGDMIAFGQGVRVEGEITGDLIVFAEELILTGKIGGSIRGFTKSASIEGTVGRSLTCFSERIDVRSGASIGYGALLFAKSVEFAGRASRDVMAHTATFGLHGFVGGDLSVHSDELTISSAAEVGGKTTYQGPSEPTIEPGARLASPLEKSEGKPAYYSWRFYWNTLLGYASILALGAVLLLISPPTFRAVTREARRPGALIGPVVVLAIPIAAVIACFTFVGFALGMVSTMLWLILLYAAQIFVGGTIGEILLGPAGNRTEQFGRLAVGLAIIRVVSALRYILLPGVIPWLVFWLIVASWGFGAISLAVYERLRAKSGVLQPPATQPAA